ncbi:hypothetical protein Goari_007723 [Gossypium aridum]|uniref:Uncharacterized protein n=1 Tax=Gossypium aridum TaxID=34290 RepID=A0A7J8XRX4_GOSAI|nr:hypothetical protein [Gossypium aridum]
MEYLSRVRVNCWFNLKLDFIYKRTKRKKERDRSVKDLEICERSKYGLRHNSWSEMGSTERWLSETQHWLIDVGNPGLAGLGAIVRDSNGYELSKLTVK